MIFSSFESLHIYEHLLTRRRYFVLQILERKVPATQIVQELDGHYTRLLVLEAEGAVRHMFFREDCEMWGEV